MIPNATLMRDVLTEAATTAAGVGLMLSGDGRRDLFGEALHMIGVPDAALVDGIMTSHLAITTLGALTAYIESGQMWDRGKRADAVQWMRIWAARRTVGEIRIQLRDAGVTIEEESHDISR